MAYVSALHRRHLARRINSPREESDELNRGGIAHGLTRYCEDANAVLHGKNSPANYIIDSSSNPPITRLHCARAIVRCTVYLNERNSPYSTPAWRILRGQDKPEAFRDIAHRRYCCGVSGLEGEMSKCVAKDLGVPNERKCLDSLVEAMRDMNGQGLVKGMNHNIHLYQKVLRGVLVFSY